MAYVRFPRTRGDRPVPEKNLWVNWQVPPRTRGDRPMVGSGGETLGNWLSPARFGIQ